MRTYIENKIKDMPYNRIDGRLNVIEVDELPQDINLEAILNVLEKNFPSHYYNNLKALKIEHSPEFDERGVNAVYRDNILQVTNKQSDTNDLIDDIVHEFAHHLETLYPEQIYGDEKLINEFLKKRQELKFELQSEGYWVREYNFDKLKFDESFDKFLYQRVGRNMLRLVTAGSFIRPYAAVSLREYFATGFEAYYLGKRDTLENISPVLYDKIEELHNLERY
tara:strand:+ start:1535 stop:2203 length:669 start_codon:yes stop_codon:yes gene_type:complete